MADPQVLSDALREGRVLLTWDKDFGDLVFRDGREGSCGVVLVRVHGTRTQAELAGIVIPVLEAHVGAWQGHYSVIDRRRLRIRRLPERGE